MKAIYKISGMNCGSCAKVIKYGLEEMEGIKSIDVDFNSAQAFLEYDDGKTNPVEIKNKIKDLGYQALE
jgi:copper chaperone CopZ